MEFIIIIIIFVVISLISAAAKKKPNSNAEDEYVRPTLSDIQRAFMMSSEMASPAEQQPEPAFSQQAVTQPESSSYASEEYAVQPAPPVSAFQSSNRYASIDLATFHTDSAEMAETPKKAVRQHKSSLKLFEDKNDFVRAVIYSEILTRKGH